MLATHLLNLGFNQSEMRVYLALAELGKSSAANLAKKIGIPRTTAYSVLGNLVRHGIVSEEKSSAGTYYCMNSPQSLLRMVETERADLSRKEAAAAELVKLIEPYFKSKNFSVPKFEFFDGAKNVNAMLYDFSERWMKSVLRDDNVWWGYQDHTFVEQYRPWLEYYWKLKPREQRIYLLSNVSTVEEGLRGKVAQRIIRPVPPAVEISSTVWALGGEYITMIMTRQKPHYAFQIQDRVFGANLKAVFKWLWALTNDAG